MTWLNALAATIGYVVMASLLLVGLLAAWECATAHGPHLACELGVHAYRRGSSQCQYCGEPQA